MTATDALSKLAACSDAYLTEAQAAPAGGPDNFSLSGVSNHGEHFAQSTLDMLATGAGAYSHHDGVWTQGQHDIERLNISNAEALEFDLPILYLWRGLARDSGGAGRRRGGLSLGAAYAVHKSDGLECRLGCHGWEIPNSPGAFGGLPSNENRRTWWRDADARVQMAAGHVPAVEELAGEVTPTTGRQGAIRLGPRDVVFKTPQAGGGWGDPLDRPTEAVQDDLEFGAISPEAARTLYGAVLDAAGRVDAAATAAHRETLRAARRAWPAQKSLATAPAADTLAREGPLGDALEVVRDAAGVHWTRCRCGRVLAPAGENWREYAGRKLAAPAELGPEVRLHPEMEVRRYACPGCGRLHAVDVCRAGDPDRQDIRLALT
jgi:N-methylhydantoinase B